MTVRDYSTTAADNDAAPPNGAPEGCAASTINDIIRQVMAEVRDSFEEQPYFDWGNDPTRVDNDTFTVATDLTARYAPGLRVKLVGATTGYGLITASSHAAGTTTIDVTMDSGNVPTSLTRVAVTPEPSATNASVLSRALRVNSVGGTANAITGSVYPAPTAYAKELMIILTPTSDNTSTTTLNINSLGALDVFNIDGTACVGGELKTGIPALLMLDTGGDDWIIVNPNVLKSRGQEVGRRYLLNTDRSGSYTFVSGDEDQCHNYTGAGGHTWTLPIGSTMTVGSQMVLRNGTSGVSLSIAIGGGGTLVWNTGTGTATTGSPRTLVGGSKIVAHYIVNNVWDIVGSGIS